jgi:HTH-type transcriptional regulator/antitoxin HigA
MARGQPYTWPGMAAYSVMSDSRGGRMEKNAMRQPAETFPPGEFIRDEMAARGWSDADAHARLGNDPVRCCAFDLAAYADDKYLILDTGTAKDLALLFGGTAGYWIQVDRAWRS